MKKYVILVAGGTGSRLKSDIPKQFIPINKKPILMHTIQAFYTWDENAKIIVVLPEHHIDLWKDLCKEFKFDLPYQITFGGPTRFHSVQNALTLINDDFALVGIHDGARPLIDKKTIVRCFEAAEKHKCAIPVIPVPDSIRMVTGDISEVVKREEFRIVQTPQCFHSKLIKDAYKLDYDEKFTDDATVAENSGFKIHLVEGNPDNKKITYSHDIKFANAFLKKYID